jgi:hypothetical protein
VNAVRFGYFEKFVINSENNISFAILNTCDLPVTAVQCRITGFTDAEIIIKDAKSFVFDVSAEVVTDIDPGHTVLFNIKAVERKPALDSFIH